MNKLSNFDKENIEFLKAKIEKEKNNIEAKNSHYTLIEGGSNIGPKVSISDKNRKIIAEALINSK